MSEVKPPGAYASQPKTKEIPAADKNEILIAELKSILVSGLGRLETSLDLQQEQIRSINAWKGSVEVRLNKHSDARRLSSSIDLDHEAKLAGEIEKNLERDEQIAKTYALATSAAKELERQSRAMGIGQQGMRWVRSKAGRETVGGLVILVSVLWNTIHLLLK